jgi:hypothetical protein
VPCVVLNLINLLSPFASFLFLIPAFRATTDITSHIYIPTVLLNKKKTYLPLHLFWNLHVPSVIFRLVKHSQSSNIFRCILILLISENLENIGCKKNNTTLGASSKSGQYSTKLQKHPSALMQHIRLLTYLDIFWYRFSFFLCKYI